MASALRGRQKGRKREREKKKSREEGERCRLTRYKQQQDEKQGLKLLCVIFPFDKTYDFHITCDSCMIDANKCLNV